MFAFIIYRIINRIKSFCIKLRNNEFVSKIKFGENSRLYPTAYVENLQSKEKLSIGCNSHIRGELFVYPYGEGLSIGNNCYVGINTIIRAGNHIMIGNSVLIAHNVTIIDSDSHEIDANKRNESFINMIKHGHPKISGDVKTAPINISDNVWISYGACILKGVTIGEGAIVGAGSVVTKDVPAWTLVAGNPARVIKKLPR